MRLVKESRIVAAPSKVFAFHESPGALERLTPPWESVRVIEGGGSLRPGSRVTLESWLGPIRLVWVAEHTEYEPGRMFADRQVHGPFTKWYHRHLFLDDGEGGTLLRDDVDYAPPLRAVGRILAGRFLEAKLKKLFDFRHETTKRIVEAGDFLGA
jgi:ligand-binding SRPBCC domain-containing protein